MSARYLKKSQLSLDRRLLVELMQGINFGRVENLVIRNGQPVLASPASIVREFKFGSDNAPRPELDADDFVLKRQLVELFDLLDDYGDGVIEVLEIKHGMPFRMTVMEKAA